MFHANSQILKVMVTYIRKVDARSIAKADVPNVLRPEGWANGIRRIFQRYKIVALLRNGLSSSPL